MQMTLTTNKNTNDNINDQGMPDRNINVSSSLIAAMLITLIAAFFIWPIKPSTLSIKQVHIEGEFIQLDINYLQELLTNQLGSSLFNTDITAIHNKLMSLPWVRQVSIHRVWPDSLKVVIHEQTAIAKWGKIGLLNDQGHFFSPAIDSPLETLPVLEGYKESQKILLQKFKSLKNDYGLNVVRLRLDKRRAWEFELDSGLIVVLGRRDFQKRVKRFVYTAMINLGEKLSQAKKIDMQYTNGFSVEWKQDATKSIDLELNN